MKKLLMALTLMMAFGCGSADKMTDKMEDSVGNATESVKDDATDAANEAMKMDVVDTAIKSGNFTTLVTAVNAAGLADTLKGPGPFTVFAPTDDAFAALPEGTVEGLLKPEAQEQLANILKFHVVSGNVMAADATTMDIATLFTGKNAAIVKGEDGSVTYAGANVTTADIECTNGVIHVIDAVVMPPEGDATAAK